MEKINVRDIAAEILQEQKETGINEIAEFIDSEVNGRQMTVETMPSEIVEIMVKFQRVIRKQNLDFTIALVHQVVEELQSKSQEQ